MRQYGMQGCGIIFALFRAELREGYCKWLLFSVLHA